MSMLEDLFLEDEAGEAQELERVLEGGGDDYDERPLSPTSDNNEEGEDEAEEDKRRVDPAQGKVKRVIKNPRFVLNPARLTGPRGIQVIPEHFKDFKFKGKGHEKEDLDMVLKKLEHWAYRLYPKFAFHDCLKKIETLGKKRPVMVHLKQIRSDQFVSAETVVQRDSSDDEAPPAEEDEFDKLLQQQIELARATPAPPSATKSVFSTPSVDRSHMMPKATSSPSISDEQRERMRRNRQLAEERRLAKLRNEDISITSTPIKHMSVEKVNENYVDEMYDKVAVKKHNRSNVIDSSDDDEVAVVNESITIDVDVHKKDDNTSNNAIHEHRSNVDMDVIPIDTEINKPDNDFDNLIASDNGKNDNDIESKNTQIDNAKTYTEINKPVSDFDKLISSGNEDGSNNGSNDNEKENIIENQLDPEDETEVLKDSNTKDNDVEQHEPDSNDVMNQSQNKVDEINDKTEEVASNINDISKDKDVNPANSDKENVDSNVVEDMMDVDFSDDF